MRLHDAIRPRLRSWASSRPRGGDSDELPSEFFSLSVRRLQRAVLWYACAYSVIHLSFWLMHWSGIFDKGRIDFADYVSWAAIVYSVGLYVYLRRHGLKKECVANAGFQFLVVGALGIALSELCSGAWLQSDHTGYLGISWVAVWITAYPLIMPLEPRPALVGILLAASAGPIIVIVQRSMGVISISLAAFIIYFLPNYICAVLGVISTRTVLAMGRDVQRARQMGSYHLEEMLGCGGMGEVWRARHFMLARPAAIKFVKPEILGPAPLSGNEIVLRRFEREAQATAALHSPHSINLFDFGVTDEGTFYYVMELLDGVDLEELVQQHGPLPAERVVYLMRQVCHSLADAHASQLIHRDIKPANVYICRMGLEHDFVKVLDFGLVKGESGRLVGGTQVTMENVTTGTPAYMAPEMATGDGDVDARSDLYALGCVGYFLLTGCLVFEGDTPMKILLAHIQDAAVPPSRRTELEIPAGLEEIILACLAKEPHERPQNARELGARLERLHFEHPWSEERAARWWEINRPCGSSHAAVEGLEATAS